MSKLTLTTNFAPVFDARHELERLRAMVGALWYLSRPHEDDAGMKDLNEMFAIIEGSLSEAVSQLAGAIDDGHVEEVQAG